MAVVEVRVEREEVVPAEITGAMPYLQLAEDRERLAAAAARRVLPA